MRAHITNEPVLTKAGKMYTNELFTCEVFNKHTASAGLFVRYSITLLCINIKLCT